MLKIWVNVHRDFRIVTCVGPEFDRSMVDKLCKICELGRGMIYMTKIYRVELLI
jgi:hypothetical protein